MNVLMQNLGTFFLYAIIAVFAQNAVFTRGFGVSRLTKLVGDSTVDSFVFCGLLCLVQVVSAPLGFLANQMLSAPHVWYRDYVRPLSYIVCILIAFGLVLFIIALARPANQKDLAVALPIATLNCAVLGPMLITSSQNYDFVQTMGFALGSGIGYTLAVIIVTEGQRKMSGRNVPSTFKGLPINLLYIGILALAIYGITGHSQPI